MSHDKNARWGVWFCGGKEGKADWMRDKYGNVLTFLDKSIAEQWRDLLITTEEQIDIRRYNSNEQAKRDAKETEPGASSDALPVDV